jgi:hypothetical protein
VRDNERVTPILLLSISRETAITVALVALGLAGLVVSFGAWTLFRRERRAAKEPGAEPQP